LSRVYRPELLLADHAAPVVYEMPLPPQRTNEDRRRPASLYVHAPRGRKSRAIDATTERFVEETRMGAAP
jgi:hopanoid C-3 methylase